MLTKKTPSRITGRERLLAALMAGGIGCSPLLKTPTPTTARAAKSAAEPDFLAQYAATYGFSLGRPSNISLTPQGETVIFLRSGPRSFVRDLYAVDTSTGRERLLLAAEAVLNGSQEQLTADELARRERMRIGAMRGITSYELSESGKWVLVPFSGELILIELTTGHTHRLNRAASYPLDPRLSPDGRQVAFVRNGDLYVIDSRSRKETRLTNAASDTISNGLAEFVAQEEMGRYHGAWWSPDSKMLVYQRTDTAGVERMHILDPQHPQQPARAWPYPRAGTRNAEVRLGLIAASGGSTTWIEWDREAYTYLATVKWVRGSPLTIVVQNRAQTEEVVLAVDPKTGTTRPLLVDRDDAWLNINQKLPHWLESGQGFLWHSESSGHPQLELRDRSGELRHTLTRPEFVFDDLVSVDEERGVVWVTSAADPTQRQVYRVPLDPSTGSPEAISRRRGKHQAIFSKNHAVYVHSVDALEGQPQYLVKNRDGQLVGELRSVAEEPPFALNVEITRVGERELCAAVIRPRNFIPGQRHPVIVRVYAGPGRQSVTAARGSYPLLQWIADHGFVVVSLDGRGTPSRGRAWERAIKGNLIDVALADQVSGLKALGAKYPELDLTRVGIFGWSFGGYFSAMAVMQRPDVYHTGIAGAPVADWLDYDTHYTERYLGLPRENPTGYQRSSVLTHASKLKRPLLIIHGTNDDNVYFMNSLRLSDALFRANKQHEFLPLAGFTHGVPEPLVTERLYARMVEHLIKHLM